MGKLEAFTTTFTQLLWVLMQKENTEQLARYSELCEPKSSA